MHHFARLLNSAVAVASDAAPHVEITSG